MIDKESEGWSQLTLWFGAPLACSRSKHSAIMAEFAMLLLGLVSWAIIDSEARITPFIFLFAYAMGWVNRYDGIKKGLAVVV